MGKFHKLGRSKCDCFLVIESNSGNDFKTKNIYSSSKYLGGLYHISKIVADTVGYQPSSCPQGTYARGEGQPLCGSIRMESVVIPHNISLS